LSGTQSQLRQPTFLYQDMSFALSAAKMPR